MGQRQCATHSHSFISRRHSPATASLCTQAGQLRKNHGAARRHGCESKGEAWEGNLPPDAGIDLYDEAGARKPYASLVQDQHSKVCMRTFLELTDDPDRAFLAKSYDENTPRAYRNPRDIPHFHRRFSATNCRPCRSVALVGILATDGRACAGNAVMRAAVRAPHIGTLGLCRRADIANLRESAERDAARDAAGRLQEPCWIRWTV